MRITAIYATGRKERSTTYQLAKTVIDNLKGKDEVHEFFLPKDMNHFCIGCYQCFADYRERCGGYDMIQPIREAMNESDLIIFTAPVYAYHVPGQLKSLLDHFACEWVVHRPNPNMFHKQALIITTACGAGMSKTVKDIKDSMDYWCVGRVYTYKKGIFKGHWDELKPEVQESMKKRILKTADKIKKHEGNVTPRLKVKAFFYIFRSMHGKKQYNPVDVRYWKKKGWLGKVRPW